MQRGWLLQQLACNEEGQQFPKDTKKERALPDQIPCLDELSFIGGIDGICRLEFDEYSGLIMFASEDNDSHGAMHNQYKPTIYLVLRTYYGLFRMMFSIGAGTVFSPEV